MTPRLLVTQFLLGKSPVPPANITPTRVHICRGDEPSDGPKTPKEREREYQKDYYRRNKARIKLRQIAARSLSKE